MTKIQITPWKYHSQLRSVRDRFYPPASNAGGDLREEACSLVWVWKHRGNLPHAVEATALLTDAILHDDPGRNSTFSIRATYSLAFCRFVTGLVDSKLHGPKLSMYQKAMMLGVPASFVELRHEATHRDLPSLVVLRSAALRSLDWLWEFYWAKLDFDQYEVDWSEGEGTSKTTEDKNADADAGVDMDMDTGVDGLKKEAWKRLKPIAKNKKDLLKTIASKGGNRRKNTPYKKSKSEHAACVAAAELSYFTKAAISLCCRERLGSTAVVQVLLDREGDVMVPLVQMDNGFWELYLSSWDEFLKEICRRCKPFLTGLVEEMTRILVTPTSKPDDDETYLQNIVRWMDHLLTSETWASFRKRYLVLSYVEVLCAESAQDPTNTWTSQLQEILKKQPPLENAGTVAVAKNGSTRAKEDTAADIEMDDGDGKVQLREDPQSDVTVLRDFGWDFGEKPALKAIGVV